MNTTRLDELQVETGIWRDANFSPVTSVGQLQGVIEEVGELTHSHLKQAQGIRGTSEEHEANGKDAVGDIMVYLMGYASTTGWKISEAHAKALRHIMPRYDDADRTILLIANRVGRLSHWEAEHPNGLMSMERLKLRCIGEILRALELYCRYRNWDLVSCVEGAWAEVQKRDWIKNPERGVPVQHRDAAESQ